MDHYISDEISPDGYYRSHKFVDNFCVLYDFITLTDIFQLYCLYWPPPNLCNNSLADYNNTIISLVYSIFNVCSRYVHFKKNCLHAEYILELMLIAIELDCSEFLFKAVYLAEMCHTMLFEIYPLQKCNLKLNLLCYFWVVAETARNRSIIFFSYMFWLILGSVCIPY